MDTFASLACALSVAEVRHLVIGVWGANYYAASGCEMFTTLDRDLFLPADPDNLLGAWRVCEANGFGLFAGAPVVEALPFDNESSVLAERRDPVADWPAGEQP